MKVSRRHFMAAATGAAATLWSPPPIGLDTLGSRPEPPLDCVVLDLNSHCFLRESLQGYQLALAGEHSHLPVAELNSRCRCRIMIVPGLGAVDPGTAFTLAGLLRAGTNLLLESAAGFLSPSGFTAHQKMLHRYFGIAIDSPVDLWQVEFAHEAPLAHHPGRYPWKKLARQESVPYVNYLWPLETKVRDFSHVIPVSMGAKDIIGRVGTVPVALKKRVADGTLIFLGSPMGPSLRAGDLEARSWLRLVTSL